MYVCCQWLIVCMQMRILTGMELSFASDMTFPSAMEKLSARKVSKAGMPRRWSRSTTNICLPFCPCDSTLLSNTYIKTSAHTYTLYNSYTSELRMRIHALVIIIFTALPYIHVSRFAHLSLLEHIGYERLLGQVARHMFLVKIIYSYIPPMVRSSNKQTKSY